MSKKDNKKPEDTPNTDNPKDKGTPSTDNLNKQDTPKDPDITPEQFAKLKEDNERLRNQVSAKDKKANEIESKVGEFESKLERLQNQTKVRDLLLETEMSEPVRNALKADLEDLTPEKFEKQKSKYENLFNAGLENKKDQTRKDINQDPKSIEAVELQEKIKNAKNREELDKIMSEAQA